MPRYNKSKEEREKEAKKRKILSQLLELSDKPLTSIENISDYLQVYWPSKSGVKFNTIVIP